jgi:PGF-pre-PGF domain-containing protein
MKHDSGILLKAISIFFAIFILFSSFPLQVSAENAMFPGISQEDNLVLTILNKLVEGDSGTSLQPMVTETGKISLSVDGLGTSDSGTIQVEKPEGATVRNAYLIAAGTWGSQIPEGSVLIDGNPVYWNNTVHSTTCYNYWANVTSFVKPAVDIAPAGRVNFTITETSPYSSDGEVLAVIFDDPNQAEENTVILMFGCQDPAGDTFNIRLADPINKNNTNLMVNMGLGISFSYQASGGSQVSNIDVNGERVTSSAGGEDDGFSGNGALLTAGGLDDSNENPSDPLAGPSNPRTDDELYNLLPFVNDGDTNVTVFTRNPSNDDNIFFSYFFLKSSTAMVGEGILLSPASGSASSGSHYTLSSMVQDTDGNPLSGKAVNFSVVSGPNAGHSENVTTDAFGRANFSYSGTSSGTDLVKASFVNTNSEVVESNPAIIEWIVPSLPVANFSASPVTGPAPLTVRFTDESDNAVSWEWDVDGDGQVDYVSQIPVHTYETPGSYNVSLYVSNSYGNDTNAVKNYINVLENPITSERRLSKTSVYPGEEFAINLSIESTWNLRNLTVDEYIPEGWNLTIIDNSGAEFNSSSSKWVWDNFSAGENKKLVYTLKAPLDSDFGLFELEGNVSAENVTSVPVEGENEITVTPISDYNPKDLKLLHVSDPDQEFNISSHMLCNFTWYVNGKESIEGNAINSAYASLFLSPEALWENENFKNNYTSVENSSLFAGKYFVTSRVSNGSASINQTWNFLITRSAESKNNINNTVVLPVREVEENESVTFNFTDEPDNTDDNSVLAISFNASSAGNVSVFVEVLKDRASEVSKDPEGEVYQHINIHISNQTVMNETGSDSKFIDFKVNRTWMETVVQGTVRLNRYHNGEWKSLNTWETGSDAKFYYFRAETPGFSPFSVTAEKISTPSFSTSRKGGSGTGSASIISSSKVEDESISGAGIEGADSIKSGETEGTRGSNESDSGKSVFIGDENDSKVPVSGESSGSGQSGGVGAIFLILLLLLIAGAYLTYRQTKDKK